MYDGDDYFINDQCQNKREPSNETCDDCISYPSLIVICAELFNSLKSNSQLTKYVIVLILEVKEIIASKSSKSLLNG